MKYLIIYNNEEKHCYVDGRSDLVKWLKLHPEKVDDVRKVFKNGMFEIVD